MASDEGLVVGFVLVGVCLREVPERVLKRVAVIQIGRYGQFVAGAGVCVRKRVGAQAGDAFQAAGTNALKVD